MKRNKLLYYAFIIGFVILYLATALISYCHAIEFFQIGNVHWMSMTLAAVFELGQMVVLSSLLLSDNKKTIIPWILLIILTAVQVVGNVFSVYKFISINKTVDYVYLQGSLIDWWLSGVEQKTIMVIISWIIGALLPIIALFMTSMVANNIQLMKGTTADEEKYDPLNEPIKEEDVNTSQKVIEPVNETKKEEEKKEKPQTKVIIQPKEKEIIREIIKEPSDVVNETEQQKREMVNMSADTLRQI